LYLYLKKRTMLQFAFLKKSLLIALPILFFACKSKNMAEWEKSDNQGQEPPAHTIANNQQVGQMTEKIIDSSLGFYQSLSQQQPGENLSFSPASLNMAMAIVYSGSRAETQKQISDVFGFDRNLDVFHPSYAAYFASLLNIALDTTVEFDLANRVFLEQTYPVTPDYASAVENWHRGAFEKLDFKNNTSLAEASINQWVEQITRDRIKDLIPSGSLSSLTRLVLVNALYIKSSWKYPFDKYRTTVKNFTTWQGNLVRTKFMIQGQKGIPFYEHSNFIAMELPYTTPDLSIIFIRPNATKVPDISKYVPDAKTYQEILEGLRPQEVVMEIPSFKIESEFSLNNLLIDAGVKDAFDQRADFSGITGYKDLSVSNVFQKVFFEIDEEGSEAAAATGAVMVTTSMPIDPPKIKEFIADRPFLFILKENKYNTPLFVGQYVK
jgi:serpin B